MITIQADFNHMDAGGRLRLGDLRMHQHTPFVEIAAKHETIIFVRRRRHGHASGLPRTSPPREEYELMRARALLLSGARGSQ